MILRIDCREFRDSSFESNWKSRGQCLTTLWPWSVVGAFLTASPYNCSASGALCARACARQTGALTRGRRCKPVCGLSEGPPSCYCLWFKCVVGQGGRVLRTHSPVGQTQLKSLLSSCVGGWARRVRSARKRAADARRLVSMSRPSFGGAGALRGGDHEHQHGHHHLEQEARVQAPRAPAWLKVYVTIVNTNIKSTRVARARTCSLSRISFLSSNVLYLEM